jgi:hypothetical protein
MVDDPDLIEPRCADRDLIELGVVGDRVHVQQV